jgi:hypothetical protein
MNCDCIQRIDEKLAERNFALDTSFLLGEKLSTMTLALSIGTHWKDSTKRVRGKKPPTIVVTFCPFCGKRTATEKAEGADGNDDI